LEYGDFLESGILLLWQWQEIFSAFMLSSLLPVMAMVLAQRRGVFLKDFFGGYAGNGRTYFCGFYG
jgi:hypothetical protein